MKTLWAFKILGLLCVALCGCVRQAPAMNLGNAERWQPMEIRIEAGVKAANPFKVRLEAEVTSPDGSKVTLPGFNDGEGVWKLRVMPHIPGTWNVVTSSDEADLDGRRYQFTCTANATPAQHGRLRVDEKHPHHFVFEDGTHHFMLAYECDWLWALDTDDAEMTQTRRFLDRIGSHGFNTVIVNSFAYDTSWRAGKSGPDDFGPPPRIPWQGTAEKPDHQRLNLAFWQHYDRMIQALHERGMITHMLCKVYNKKVKWPKRGSKADDLFFRTLIARYSAYPGIVWDFAKEAHNEKNLNYKLGRLRDLRERDPFRHLVTVHDDDRNYESGAFDALVDFRTDQQHSDLRNKVLEQRGQRAWPIMNSEFGYEQGAGGPADVTYAVAQSPEEFVQRAWEISFAGGCTAYYHTHTAWDVLRPEIDPPGYRLFGLMRQFFETTKYWELSPRNNADNGGIWVLENPGNEYVLWLSAGKSATLTIPPEAGVMNAVWFHPHTGKRQPAVEVKSGAQIIAPPPELAGGAAVLHLMRTKP